MITWIDIGRVWALVAVLTGILVLELRQLGRYLQSKKQKSDRMWRSHTEVPTCLPTTALVAFVSDEDGTPYCAGEIYAWSGDTWRRESDGVELPERVFWWLSESDLLALLPVGAGVEAV